MKTIVFCFGFLLFAISCNNSQITSSNSDKMNDFEVLYLSEYGGSGQEKTITITDREEFEKFWNSSIHIYSESTIVPEVDFSKKNVVIKHFPSRNSGGSTYEIISVQQTDAKTEIFYKVTSSGEMATMAITSPMMIVAITKTDNPVVEFKVKN